MFVIHQASVDAKNTATMEKATYSKDSVSSVYVQECTLQGSETRSRLELMGTLREENPRECGEIIFDTIIAQKAFLSPKSRP